MEDQQQQLKSGNHFSPMLTSFASFDGSMDASAAAGGYYYHSSSSADSSPVMAGVSSFDSSPSHSPPFYGSFPESSGGSPQYYLQADSAGSCQLEQYQPVQEFFSTATSSPVATSNNNNNMGHLLMEQQQQSPKQQQPSVHIPGLNELTRLFNMAGKVEDKLAIQEKINSLLHKHLPVNKRQQQQQQQQKQQMLLQQQQQMTYLVDSNGLNSNQTLITPPLSPNCDNMGMFMSKQNPMFVQHSPLKLQSNSGIATRSPMHGGQVVKVEPLSPTLMGRKISQSSFGGEAANNNNINNNNNGSCGSPDSAHSSGLLLAGGGQSPSSNSPAKAGSIYFEQQQQQQYTGGQQYNGSNQLLLSDQSAPLSELVSMDHQSTNQCANELKSMMVAAAAAAASAGAVKPSKIGKGKGKGKGKKSGAAGGDLRKSAAAAAASMGSFSHGSPPQSQKRTAHLSAEFRYRTKLNDKISKLRSLVGQKVHLSKSAVLTRSIERIVKLQKLTIRLHESNLRLQSLVAKYTGGQSVPAAQNTASETNKPLMSIKELTRSLSVGSGTSMLNSGRNSQFGGNNSQTTIDIDLAKYIDSQMLSSPESDHLPSTIESTVNCSNGNSNITSSPSVPSVVSTAASQSLALNSTDEVFDFDQFLDQF